MKLSEQSFISVSLMGAIIGSAFWLTMVYANGQENKENIADLKTAQERVDEKLDIILEKVIRLEEKRGR